jgi:UDP-GlcNAc:undecaprenyl-phosphate GlcNAc-1-phosphate transferase
MWFIVPLGLSFFMTPLAARLGSKFGLIDRGEDPLKIHREPVPVTGGLAIVAVFFLTMWAAGGHLPLGMIAGVLLVCAIGVIDDRRPLSPAVRVLLLIVAGILVSAAGLGGERLDWIGASTFVLLLVLSANAVNMVDGQNGLAGGLAAIASLGLAAIALIDRDADISLMGLIFAGALFGFLPWNFPRAKTFLGNGGAYSIAFLLAYQAGVATTRGGAKGLILAGSCLAVFGFEFAFTVLRRLFRRSRLTTGDRDHSYDIASRRMRRNQVTVIFWIFGGLVSLLAIFLAFFPLKTAVWAAATGWALGGVAALFLGRRQETAVGASR